MPAEQKAGRAWAFKEVFIYSLPKARRLRKTDEFSSVFDFRRSQKLGLVQIFSKPSENTVARLGLVVGKKAMPRAVDRNLARRILREAFRLKQGQLPNLDIIIRVPKSFSKVAKTELRQNADALLQKL